MPTSESSFRRALRRAFLDDGCPERELRLHEEIAVRLALGNSRAEVARRTTATPAELRRAYERVKRVAPRLDRDSDF